MKKMIALVDCNNFYASCERLFQPRLQNKPIVVLSNNDGCVIARSDEAKELGIEMGAPSFLIETLLQQHNVSVFSSNYTLYGDLSDRVMTTLSQFANQVEVYSIDEAFLNLSSFRHHNLTDYAHTIRNTVMQHTGIPVSVGIAPSKTLAKIANRLVKKRNKQLGVYCIDSKEKIQFALQNTPVKDIWGIGSQYTKLLTRNGFNTAWDLSRAPSEWVRKNLSVVGQRMYNELNGISCITFEEMPPKKKMVCVARGFGKVLNDKNEVMEALANYTAMVAAKLRSEQLATSTIQIFVQTNAHRANEPQYFRSLTIQLPVATNNTNELITHARQGFETIYRPGYNYSKTGCTAMELKPVTEVQSNIFDRENRARNSQLMQVLDKVNRSFGKNTVRFALQGFSSRWKLRQLKLSPCYTTRIEEVLTIKI
ncbi:MULTISPECIES: Y-family DNA polymerase [Niastella]|uniref:Y-family DNA polymerase n=1 Tax=Niastella soli TaxID=2821487 RepID=A0ABS3YLV0_9BACT|nr:Y-family DNA polymerase [Niastella soli]MBO9198877.1 Y-family DNA polymerase [Niastella soli]